MTRKRFLQLLSLMLFIAMLCVIWHFSSENGKASAETSRWLSKSLAESTADEPTPLRYRVFSRIVRKGAHMAEFALLMLTVLFTERTGLIRTPRPVFFAVLTVLFCAMGDELHQGFVPGRSCAGGDVAVDMCGALLMLLIVKKHADRIGMSKKKQGDHAHDGKDISA